MRKNYFFIYLALSVLLVVFTVSCFDKSSRKEARERHEILEGIKTFQKDLPYPIEGTGITITGMELEGDIIVYTYTISDEDWEEIAGPDDVANSDRNLARIISNISSTAVNLFIKHHLGLKMIYKSADSGKIFRVLEMSPEKLKEIKEKKDKGEIDAYTLLELTQMEIDQMKFPTKLEDGVWLTNAYIKGHSICYEARLENTVDPSDVSSSDLAEMKQSIIEGLKEDGVIEVHKSEIIKENIHFTYIYRDDRGVEIGRLDISPSELLR